MPTSEAVNPGAATAVATARAVRDGAISALEACDAAIARIERSDGAINAVVVRDFERARAAAKALDARRESVAALPLCGVPMTVKESNDVAGLPTTWGIAAFKDLPIREDAVAVARLKAAGAVILGKTNAPVALADWQAANPIYGRTVNPHDHARSPGGSSGGAAAALAAGMVPLELGSDIGGSIRVPAHMCGVYGHKPTYGIVPLKGHGFPGTDGIEVPLAVVGPMARSAEDLSVALDVLAGPMPGSGYRLDLPPPRHRALSEYRVLVLDAHPVAPTDAAVRDAVNGLAERLARSGARVVRKASDLPDLAAAHGAYTGMLMAITTRGAPGATPIDAHAWMELQDEQMRVARRWGAVFAEVDVVLAPPFGVPAFPHEDTPDWAARTLTVDGEATRYGAQIGWPGVATFPGLPATCMPVAKSREGLPIGVQIIAGMFEDRTAIAFAGLLQREGLAG
ncbi:amidase family protein [Desertibaculum subflavum]|uniref:amidase family protein n=1 Tax=Desertibaculum subflavum TaxID=2268458 RepID=UPI000E66BBD1